MKLASNMESDEQGIPTEAASPSSVSVDAAVNSSSAASSSISATPATAKKPSIRHAEKRRTSTCIFADRVARVSIDAYRRHVIRSMPSSAEHETMHLEPTCLACIVACVKRNVTAIDKVTNYNDNIKDDELFVVGLGVGTKFLSEHVLRHHSREEAYGSRVRDCHAEVLARRAFRRCLSLEILKDLKGEMKGEEHANQAPNIPRILERVDSVQTTARTGTHIERPQYRLRADTTLHFYSSSCPCGNATLKRFATLRKENFRSDLSAGEWPTELHSNILPAHSVHLGQVALLVKKDQSCSFVSVGLIRDNADDVKLNGASVKKCKHEPAITRNNSAIPPLLSAKEAKWPAHLSTDWCPPGTTTVWSRQGSIHTCSDKLARWNVLGLQGSLLASLLNKEFLFASTLTVGRKFSAVTCRRAVCCRVANHSLKATDEKARGVASVISPKDSALPSWTAHHPAVMGTGVYLNEGAVATTHVIGQDVRFHSSSCYAWWPGLNVAECIDGSTGYLVDSGTSAPTLKDQRSGISTSALTELFLEINQYMANDATTPSIASLADLRRFKQHVSSDYEQTKTQLLTKHPTLKLWTRRCP
ncbi:hypothetical protein MPSEU_000129900 [Mayamaea pseudoterrestris]|nr:hypothetical protein MPSEU_000129900 [Mayamaea pseudoterrestris]